MGKEEEKWTTGKKFAFLMEQVSKLLADINYNKVENALKLGIVDYDRGEEKFVSEAKDAGVEMDLDGLKFMYKTILDVYKEFTAEGLPWEPV